jgi:hypothetical protein
MVEHLIVVASLTLAIEHYCHAAPPPCVCVFLASGFKWGAVMHEIPISSAPS